MKLNLTNSVSAVTASALILSSLGHASAQNQMNTPLQPLAPRQMEKLGRGVVAVNQGDGKVFVSWRVLGTDAPDVAFNVYRTSGTNRPVKVNAKPLADVTYFVDANARLNQPTSYSVRPIQGGREQAVSGAFRLEANAPARPYLSVPLQAPPPVKGADGTEYPYAPNDASVGDLDGDGEYEIILHQVGRGKDNSSAGETNPPILQAYKLNGTLLWSINLGRNIRDGAHYTQFLVYDFDGDGKAEMACKTADGTMDSQGKVIGDANANYVNASGRVLSGPEYLTVFDSQGRAVATTDYIPSRIPDDPKNLTPTGDQMRAVWGDGNGNRGDRFLAGVAFLDGVRPSLVMCRGYYGRTVLAAWDFRGGKLSNRWVFDSKAKDGYSGQGNHNLSVADVDDDGKDEIIYGGMTVDDNGEGLFTTRYGHGDAIHVGDLDPQNPGLEMFRIQESFGDAGAHMVALKTGNTLWKKPSLDRNAAGGKGQGPGRGLAADIDPRYPGSESWALGAGVTGIWDAKGNQIGEQSPTLSLLPGQITYGFDQPTTEPRQAPTSNFRIYWDGDTLDELLDGNQIVKWNWEKQATTPLLVAEGCVSVNGTKANPSLSADILGDWREEVIFPTNDGKELRIFTTTIPTQRRLPTLMHDPVYRLGIALQNVGYNQPPHTSYFIGEGMAKPPLPKVSVVEPARN